jgi:hypothetical protein
LCRSLFFDVDGIGTEREAVSASCYKSRHLEKDLDSNWMELLTD